jgi:hypothetical protein
MLPSLCCVRTITNTGTVWNFDNIPGIINEFVIRNSETNSQKKSLMCVDLNLCFSLDSIYRLLSLRFSPDSVYRLLISCFSLDSVYRWKHLQKSNRQYIDGSTCRKVTVASYFQNILFRCSLKLFSRGDFQNWGYWKYLEIISSR